MREDSSATRMDPDLGVRAPVSTSADLGSGAPWTERLFQLRCVAETSGGKQWKTCQKTWQT